MEKQKLEIELWFVFIHTVKIYVLLLMGHGILCATFVMIEKQLIL